MQSVYHQSAKSWDLPPAHPIQACRELPFFWVLLAPTHGSFSCSVQGEISGVETRRPISGKEKSAGLSCCADIRESKGTSQSC